MSDHSDAPEPRTDITDLFVFQKPGDPARSILILNVNPDAPKHATMFDPEASYELKIGTNGDARADIAFHVVFTPSGEREQTATVYRATGADAEAIGAAGDVIVRDALVSFDGDARVTTAGPYRFYAGLRSDPWFADVAGFVNNFQFTGEDLFATWNVFAIVLEMPNDALGPNPHIGIWGRTIAIVHGAPAQVDQVGHPLLTALLNPEAEDQHAFNRTAPARQRELFLPRFVAAIRSFGYGEAEATASAMGLLPDILRYDYTSAAGYPNGRRLTDDILDLRLAFITNGKVTTDLVGPHTDFLPDFPYLGPPHPPAQADDHHQP